MPDFIFRANIAHFENLLTTETDAKKIAVIRKLLVEEKAKLADFHANRRRLNAAE
jgi:hypothetical protein